MQETLKNHELVSALADGQLCDEEFVRAVEWVGSAHEARSNWHAYHLVGDVMRTGEATTGIGDAAFLQRFRLRLAQEAMPSSALGAPEFRVESPLLVNPEGQNRFEEKGANDNFFYIRKLTAVAALAVVAVIGWQVFGVWNLQPGATQLVQIPVPSSRAEVALQQSPVTTGAEPQVMIRDPHLDALLAAHRQFGGTSALQMPAGFLRNATFEGVAR
jgi:sigma-E factor negative regulatory protein RseA